MVMFLPPVSPFITDIDNDSVAFGHTCSDDGWINTLLRFTLGHFRYPSTSAYDIIIWLGDIIET